MSAPDGLRLLLTAALAAGAHTAVAADEDVTSIKEIHVVFSNHLDVGFNERSWNDQHAAEGNARCEGLYSPNGERCMPLAANVTSEYFNVRRQDSAKSLLSILWVSVHGASIIFSDPQVYFPRAAAMADAARAQGSDRYIYMAQPWVVALFLDCPGSGVNDWRGQHRELLLTCPNASAISRFRRAVKQGDIFMQAFPHSSSPETYDASLFEAALDIGARLADELGVARPRTFSQRDETGVWLC
eukprot:SAG11_NODE_7867_length_1086_cov_1.507599_1_plen_243_part_00